MYAQLCKRLTEEAPNFNPPHQTCSFKQLLLNRCRIEFENRTAALESNGSANPSLSEEEEEERRQITKRKMLGNIKFIGELGKLEILSENILHLCIKELLVRRSREDPSEDLECLCQIMRTCGRILDSDKGKNLMNQYFDRMKSLASNPDLQPRIRFMLKDVIDLRHDGWVPRKAAVIEGPMPINQIAPPDDDRHSMNFRRDRETERERMTELFRHPLKTRGGLDDMLMGMPITNINININSTPSLISTQPFGHNGFGSQRDGSYRGHNNQRSGFNNYSNQRGQYKHNQNNSNSQFNQSNKDLAPRFKKTNLIVTKDEVADLALRPNSMLITKPLSLKTNNMNNRMEPPLTMPSVKQASVAQPMLMKEPLPVKQVVQEGKKQSKKDKGPNKEEVLKKFNTLIEEYWKGEIDLKQAINSYKEHKVPDKFSKEVILSGLTIALDKSDVEQEKLIKLLSNLREDNLVNSVNVQDAFKSLCHALEPENEINKVITSASVLFSTAICEHLIPLSDVAILTDNGAHYPLFLLVLQHIHKRRGKSELSDIFNKSKINLITQLPENDKTKERLSEILEERDLTFLYPLLRIQADLAKQLQADPNPQSFYKWIKENLEPSNFNDPGFINALMTVLLKYITQESSTSGGDEKAVTEKESNFLKRYQPILYAFLRDKSSLQLVALYSLQMHFYSVGFPRGQLLRWFNALYDMEIVDEEAFLNWKEDVTDAYPGKGEALFQVNQWLTWLQEAESEEEEGDD